MFSITTYKEIQDSLGFWIPRCEFRIPGTGFQFLSVELEFWIPIVSGIPDSLSCIPDSKAQDSGFHQKKFPDSEILIPLYGVISIFFHYSLFWITWVTVLLCWHILVPVCWYCRIKLLVSCTRPMWPHIKIPFLVAVWNITKLVQ